MASVAMETTMKALHNNKNEHVKTRNHPGGGTGGQSWSLCALSVLWLTLCCGLVWKHHELVAVFFAFVGCWTVAGVLLLLLRLLRRNETTPSTTAQRQHCRAAPTLPQKQQQQQQRRRRLVLQRSQEDVPSPQKRHHFSMTTHYYRRVKATVGLIACLIQLWYLLQKDEHDIDGSTYQALSVAAGYLAFDHWFSAIFIPPTTSGKSLSAVTEDALTLAVCLVILVVWTVRRETTVATAIATATRTPTTDTTTTVPSSPTLLWTPTAAVAVWTAYKMNRLIVTSFDDDQKDVKGVAVADAISKTKVVNEQTASCIQESVVTFHKPPSVLVSSDGSSPSQPVPLPVWRIHGIEYDLTDYVRSHPGGREAILLGRGRDDCTALFQSYHPFTAQHATGVLQKYRIHQQPAGTNTTVVAVNDNDVVKEDVFYQTLCQKVAETLVQQHNFHPVYDRMATYRRTVYYGFVWIALTASGVAHCRGSIVGSFFLAVFGWLNGAMGHDAGHFAVSRRWPSLNDWGVFFGMSFLCNPILWQHQHTYAHHSHTNSFDHDPDLHHFVSLLRVHRRFQQHAVYRYQSHPIFVFFAYLFVVFGTCLWIPVGMIQEGSLYGGMVAWTDRQRPWRTVGMYLHLVGYAGLILVLPFCVHKTWLFAWAAATVHLATSGLVFAVFSQINHLNEASLDPDAFQKRQALRRDPALNDSWAVQQIESSNNFCPHSAIWHVLSNGLNLQIEHHLFPGLNHCHLHLIQPTVQAVCEEHGVCYKSYDSWADLMRATLQWLDRLSVEQPIIMPMASLLSTGKDD